jgi:putative hydrolase of the HAD superfamily
MAPWNDGRLPVVAGTRARPAVIELIGVDGDDTLWHTESLFSVTQAGFRELLAPYVSDARLDEVLLATERRNIRLFGYGIKGFTLAMIETAIEVSSGRVNGAEIQAIIDAGKAMLEHPVELLDGVRPALEQLRLGGHRLVLVTKGDLFDQESKLARSGLAELFDDVQVVSEKDEATYLRVLATQHVDPAAFLMVGNSVRSDVLPVLAVGGRAVHVPYPLTWALEVAELEPWHRASCFELRSLAELPELVERL